MKKRSLFILLASFGLVLSACSGGGNPSSSEAPKPSSSIEPSSSSEVPPAPIKHQDPFVREITDCSITREFRGEFDTMYDDICNIIDASKDDVSSFTH